MSIEDTFKTLTGETDDKTVMSISFLYGILVFLSIIFFTIFNFANYFYLPQNFLLFFSNTLLLSLGGGK